MTRRHRIKRPRSWGSGSRDWSPSVAADLYEALPVGVVASGPDGENLVFNRQARELFEGTGEELDEDDCADHYGLYTADGDRLLRTEEIPLQRARGGEQLRDVILTVVPRRGPRRRISVSGGPVAGRGGHAVGAVVVIHDVTDRMAVEDDLRFHGAIADHMGEAVIVIKAADGEILYVNQTAGDMFGYRRDELVGAAIAQLNVPTEQAPTAFAAALFDGLERDGAWSGEIEHVRKDGSHFWCTVSVSPFEDAAHGTVWASVHTDVTARRSADQALRSAEEHFRRAFEDNPMGIAVVATDRRLIEANPALCAITGFTRDELVGRRFEDIVHPDDAARELPRHRAEARLITKSGEVVRVVQTATGGVAIVDPIDP